MGINNIAVMPPKTPKIHVAVSKLLVGLTCQVTAIPLQHYDLLPDSRARVCDSRSCCYSRLSTDRLPSATIADLNYPFNVYALLMTGPSTFVKWLMTLGLLKDHVKCRSCNRACNLQKKSDRIDGMVWRCTSCASKPTQSVRNCSFFSNSHLHLEDISIFIYNYITGLSLKYRSMVSGMHYKSTAIDWGNFVRDINLFIGMS